MGLLIDWRLGSDVGRDGVVNCSLKLLLMLSRKCTVPCNNTMKVCCLEIQQFVYKFTWLVPLCENVLLLLSSLVSNWICQSSCTNHMVKFLGGLSAELKCCAIRLALRKVGGWEQCPTTWAICA